MDGCTSLVKLAAASTTSGDDGNEGEEEVADRDWVREKRMKELLLATRGLLFHFPGSCRFNDGSSPEHDDWNTYVRAGHV